jgi:glutathione synthase/RimK-type ligase-like ATP-grasp enzyme
MRIALATCEELPRMLPGDQQLRAELTALGHEADTVIWNYPWAEWSDYDAVLIRTVWDYTEHIGDFLAWTRGIERHGIRLVNSADIVHWNHDKRYLLELERAGLPVIPTRWIERAPQSSLAELIQESGWPRAVLKPAVSASARRSWVIEPERADEFELHLADILRRCPAMLQPYLSEVESSGELSLIFYEGTLHHTVRKTPAAGDWRTQPEYGSRLERVTPPEAVAEIAGKAVQLVPGDPLYARVDVIEAATGPRIVELEVIEPHLFLDLAPGAAADLAGRLSRRLTSDSKKQSS